VKSSVAAIPVYGNTMLAYRRASCHGTTCKTHQTSLALSWTRSQEASHPLIGRCHQTHPVKYYLKFKSRERAENTFLNLIFVIKRSLGLIHIELVKCKGSSLVISFENF